MIRSVRSIRLTCLLVVAACASSGCLRAYNPSYFPNWGFGGDVVRTHAKPAGRPYFNNFDPKAVRLEVTPQQASNRPGTQQVLVATVYDADGQPRRSRRVEWIIDGPGYVVEVDESGWFAGRGYKVDNKFAVSHTDYREHCITRGNDDPKDDFTIRAGQTWCVISSAVEGQTTVTAYAPEVYDWDKGRVTVKLAWTESDFVFPPPVTSRSGGEAELSTQLHRFNGKELPDDLRVRYKVLEGAPAVLIAKSGGATTIAASGESREAEVQADADGQAIVRVVQPEPRAGTTKIAIEVVKPDANGFGSGTVVGRKETTVEWASSKLALDIQAPKSVAFDRETTLTLSVANTGKAEGQAVTVKGTLVEGAEFVRSDPQPVVKQDRDLTWSLPAMAAGQKQTIAVTVRPTRRSGFAMLASAETPDGSRIERRANVEVGTGTLKVAAEVPDEVAIGERFNAAVLVRNPGTTPAENVTAWVAFDAGMVHESGKNPTEVVIGSVPAGGSKRVEVPLMAKQAGRFALRVNATADGGLADRAEVGVDAVQGGKLVVVISGPDRVALNQEDTWEIRVTNPSDVPVADGVVRVTLPVALTAKSVTDGGRFADTDGAEWRLGTIPPGGKQAVRITAVAGRMTERAVLVASAAGGANGRAQGRGEATVAIAGQPALVLDVVDWPGVVLVGKKATVRVTVRNRGTGPARKVEVAASTTGAFRIGGTGADRKPGVVDGSQVRFGVLDELAAGASAVFLVELEGESAGPARVQIEARAEHLKQPLREEQAGRVGG